jgi:DNA-binding IclR family transcriptional regulator
VNLTKYTDATIIDRDLIKENLKLVREKGFSIDSGETHEDLLCMGCPVRDGSGNVIAALNLMDEKSRTDLEKLLQHVDYLKEKAQFISLQLGYRSNG